MASAKYVFVTGGVTSSLGKELFRLHWRLYYRVEAIQ